LIRVLAGSLRGGRGKKSSKRYKREGINCFHKSASTIKCVV